MAFKRVVAPVDFNRTDALTADLVGIGFNLAADAAPDPNIEDTLIAASLAALGESDLRILDLLVTWLERHHERVNADRLVRAVETLESEGGRAFWSAVATWFQKDRRLSRLRNVYDGTRIDVAGAGSRFLIERSGEDARFANTPLRIPAGELERHPALSAAELARRTYGSFATAWQVKRDWNLLAA